MEQVELHMKFKIILVFESISGMNLMTKMLNQTKKNGAEFKQEIVQDVKKGKIFGNYYK